MPDEGGLVFISYILIVLYNFKLKYMRKNKYFEFMLSLTIHPAAKQVSSKQHYNTIHTMS